MILGVAGVAEVAGASSTCAALAATTPDGVEAEVRLKPETEVPTQHYTHIVNKCYPSQLVQLQVPAILF